MNLIPNRFKHNGLFITMFTFTVLIIITVSTTITWTTIRMSEQFFFEKFSITNAKVMDHVKDSFEKYHYSIVVASNNLLQSGTVKRILTTKESNLQRMSSIYNLSQQVKRIKSNLDAYETEVIVNGKNGVSYATNRTYWPITNEELKNSLITKNTLNQPKKIMYQLDWRDEIGNGQYIVASRALLERISGYVYGAMYFSIRESAFRKFYMNYTSPGNNVFIVDKTGLIVSSNKYKLIGDKSKELLRYSAEIEDGTSDYIVKDFMGKEQIILMEYLPSFDMYLFNIIDKQTVFGELIDKRKIVLISIGIVIIALFIVLLFSRRLTNSLSKLVREIGNAPKHNFDKYVSVSGTYETRKIGIAFNNMLDELHEYVNHLVISQKKQRNAELAALQQQINPHFLYNTLTSIKFMVQQGDKEDTEEMINSFISLLQNTIGNISETITVEQEINNLKNYVFINQKRFGNMIKVNYFVAPNCMDLQIPKLILQPFIENSFFHGFTKKAEGYINVLVWQEDDLLICEVVDNGDGIEISSEENLPNTKRNQQLFSGIGIKNVHERAELIYGKPYGVNISSELGEGTKVQITFPVNQKYS